jgi:hypothetical protein
MTPEQHLALISAALCGLGLLLILGAVYAAHREHHHDQP